jgi:hypothetical protein
MEIWINILGVLAFCTIAAIAIYYGHLAAKRRRDELSALATELNWHFNPNNNTFHDEEYAHFEIFRRGHDRAAYNTLSGDLPVGEHRFPAKAGDFIYKITTHSGKSTSTHTYRFSYLIVHLPWGAGGGVPDLLIRPEGVMDKIAGAFGFDDIDFESAEFSRRFHVKSADKKFAYDVCHPRMMEFLMQTRPPAIDIERGRACMSDGRTRWEPAEFKAMLGWTQAFFENWPEHVVKELT